VNSSRLQYDVAISFAGEQSKYAKAISELLRQSGVRVFYDEETEAEFWGRTCKSIWRTCTKIKHVIA
jgi:hypothetical protein